MTKIINPFDLLPRESMASNSTTDMESSSSSVCNDTHGICPKCRNSMSTSRIPNSKMDNLLDVFWCGECRVTTPKPA